MNCNELRKDINELKSSRVALQERYNRMNNELSGKAKFRREQAKTERLSDNILEKYLSDFVEKKPELGSWHIVKEIETFKNYSNLPVQNISDIKASPNGNIVVLGQPEFGRSQIFEYSFDENGNPMLIKESDPISAPELDAVFPLSDGTILATGENGIFIYKYNQKKRHGDDRITELYGSRIEGSRGLQFILGKKYAACQLSEERILVGGFGLNILTREKKSEDGTYGEWKVTSNVFNGAEVVEKMPDGSALIGAGSSVQEYRKAYNGGWELGKRKYGIYTTDEMDMPVCKIIQLSDEKMLIVGQNFPEVPIYEYNKNPKNGRWEIGTDKIVPQESLCDFRADVQKISNNEILVYGCKYKKTQNDDKWKLIEDGNNFQKEYFERCNHYPSYTVQVSDQKIILHGWRNQYQDDMLLDTEPVTFEVSRIQPTVDKLKAQFDDIIAKGEAQ